jgi:hypothetical protein
VVIFHVIFIELLVVGNHIAQTPYPVIGKIYNSSPHYQEIGYENILVMAPIQTIMALRNRYDCSPYAFILY